LSIKRGKEKASATGAVAGVALPSGARAAHHTKGSGVKLGKEGKTERKRKEK
jgi:hypothetical protein